MCVYTHVCVCVFMGVCVCMCMYMYMYIHVYTYIIFTHSHTHTCTHTQSKDESEAANVQLRRANALLKTKLASCIEELESAIHFRGVCMCVRACVRGKCVRAPACVSLSSSSHTEKLTPPPCHIRAGARRNRAFKRQRNLA
jgi:hypothetical protein